MDIDFDLKVKLFKEYLDNGGIEKIDFPELLNDLLKVKTMPNGKADPSTVTPIVNAAMLAYVGGQLMPPFESDLHLSEYQTLLQKSIFFDQVNIETEKEFDELYDQFFDSKELLFRGLNEAKYRLYSSLQRYWVIQKKSNTVIRYDIFLRALIDNAKNKYGGILKKFLKNIRVSEDNDLAVLSFLQHYGCPTPLLDWTYSFANALYFATEKINNTYDKWEVDKYFCVYYLEERFMNASTVKSTIASSLFETDTQFQKEIVDNLKERGMSDDLITRLLPKDYLKIFYLRLNGESAMNFMMKVENLLTSPLLYFSDIEDVYGLKYCLNNNMNIINQNGVFTWNSSPTRPIEDVTNKLRRINEFDTENYMFSKCVNINKNLVGYVKKRLKKAGVTRDYIYPDPYKLSKAVFDKTAKEIISI